MNKTTYEVRRQHWKNIKYQHAMPEHRLKDECKTMAMR